MRESRWQEASQESLPTKAFGHAGNDPVDPTAFYAACQIGKSAQWPYAELLTLFEDSAAYQLPQLPRGRKFQSWRARHPVLQRFHGVSAHLQLGQVKEIHVIALQAQDMEKHTRVSDTIARACKPISLQELLGHYPGRAVGGLKCRPDVSGIEIQLDYLTKRQRRMLALRVAGLCAARCQDLVPPGGRHASAACMRGEEPRSTTGSTAASPLVGSDRSASTEGLDRLRRGIRK